MMSLPTSLHLRSCNTFYFLRLIHARISYPISNPITQMFYEQENSQDIQKIKEKILYFLHF